MRFTALIVFTLVILVPACTSSTKFSAPRATYSLEEHRSLPDGTVVRSLRTTTAEGAEIQGETSDIKTEPISAGRDTAMVGGSRLESVVEPTSLQGLYIAGVLTLLAGIAVAVYLSLKFGLIIGAAGGLIIITTRFIDTHPMLAFGGIILLGLGTAAYFAYQGKLGIQAKQALRTVVRGVDTLPEDVQGVVTAEVGRTASVAGTANETKRTITAIKAEEGIG